MRYSLYIATFLICICDTNGDLHFVETLCFLERRGGKEDREREIETKSLLTSQVPPAVGDEPG